MKTLKAIETKFLPYTERKPRRVKAFHNGRIGITFSIHHAMFDNAANDEEVQTIAARALAAKMQWPGTLIGGGTKQGMAFVFLPDELTSAIVKSDYWFDKANETLVGNSAISAIESVTGLFYPKQQLKIAMKILRGEN